MKTLAAILAIALLAPAAARADELNLGALDDAPNRVQVTTGLEYGLVAGARYSRVLPFLDRQIVLTGEAALPWARPDVLDYRVKVGALVPIVGSARWKLAGSVAPLVRGVDTEVARMTDLGVDLALVGGFYTPRWFVAGEAGTDLALTTQVTHSEAYRMTVHADARDGWYASPGANLRGGVQAGVGIGDYEIIARAGHLRDVNGDPPMIPFYGTLTVGTGW